MSRRYDKTLADYLVIAVSPALIMTLIGSLVFFLLQVFYQGNFTGRLHYILAWFIFAAVLIGRIAIEEGAERAALFAVPLAVATLVGINRYVEFRGAVPASLSFLINCGLIGLIWWCAHKLTWDCTMIDETETGSGEGLLDSAGLGKRAGPVPPGHGPDGQRADNGSDNPPPPGRWNNWRTPRGKPHAPGVWIVYFSLAAIPIFGLGQLAIPVSQAQQRRYAFCLLAVYVASGLGLLLTTSFLGLRRYLRQRRLPMPVLMAGTWIVLGCGLIVAVMGIALFVPRPNAEYAVSQIPSVMGSPDQKPSRYGVGRDGVKSDEPGRPSPDEKKGKAAPGHGKATDPKGPPSEKPGSGKPEKPNSAGGKAEEQSKGNTERPASSDKPKPESAPRQPPADNAPNDPSRSRQDRGEEAKKNPPPEKLPDADSRRSADENTPKNPPLDVKPPAMPDVSSVVTGLLPLLQFLFYAVVVGLAVFWAWRRRAELLAAIRGLFSDLRSFWERLFHSRRRTAAVAVEGAAGPAPPRPFADFADPFATGMAARLSADELVQYTFQAMEAWARENGCPRDPEQTPHEFARRAGRRERSLRDLAIRLAELYCEAAYAPGRLRISSTQPLEELWQNLRALPVAGGREAAGNELEIQG